MKTILVTGAAGRLGFVVTGYFLYREHRVHAIVRTNDQAEALRNHFAMWKENFSISTGDLTNEEDVQRFCTEPATGFDGVVHCAGTWQGGGPLDTDLDTFEHLFRTNLRTTYLLLRHSLDTLKKRGGAFIAMASLLALRADGENSIYAASKAALVTLCQGAADECRNTKARVNVIAPGTIRTMADFRRASSEEAMNFVSPDEIARTIFYLCSDDAAAVNGVVVPMYGGRHA